MSKNMEEIMLHATRMRIVQALASCERLTASEIGEKINDVPRTTLYRHINILLEADILAVAQERKIRGSLERTLTLNMNRLAEQSKAENLPQQAFGFLMNTYGKFERYCKSEHAASGNNKIFFNNTVLMMTDQEFDQFLLELQALLVKHYFDAAEGRKPRDISIISAPPEGEPDDA